MGWRDPSGSKAGWSGCLLPLQKEEKEGERLCLEAGCSGGDPAVGARFLCSIQAALSLLDVSVLSAGKPREQELSEGEVFR